jgi:CDP-diacylglycerol--glycerol-3-phosphate 3-phosphatidyltransferase
MISIYQLKPRFQNLLRPLVQRLYDNGTTANQITVLAGVVSLLVGLLIASFAHHLWLFALIPLWMILRMAQRHRRHARPGIRPAVAPGRLPQ